MLPRTPMINILLVIATLSDATSMRGIRANGGIASSERAARSANGSSGPSGLPDRGQPGNNNRTDPDPPDVEDEPCEWTRASDRMGEYRVLSLSPQQAVTIGCTARIAIGFVSRSQGYMIICARSGGPRFSDGA
jgi:hypothetical protein